jgi:hypothetical protein
LHQLLISTSIISHRARPRSLPIRARLPSSPLNLLAEPLFLPLQLTAPQPVFRPGAVRREILFVPTPADGASAVEDECEEEDAQRGEGEGGLGLHWLVGEGMLVVVAAVMGRRDTLFAVADVVFEMLVCRDSGLFRGLSAANSFEAMK